LHFAKEKRYVDESSSPIRAAEDLQEQAGGPIANPGEMASTHELVVDVIASIPGYVDEFSRVFHSPDVTIARITESIAAFEETLVTPNSRFDRWLAGPCLLWSSSATRSSNGTAARCATTDRLQEAPHSVAWASSRRTGHRVRRSDDRRSPAEKQIA